MECASCALGWTPPQRMIKVSIIRSKLILRNLARGLDRQWVVRVDMHDQPTSAEALVFAAPVTGRVGRFEGTNQVEPFPHIPADDEMLPAIGSDDVALQSQPLNTRHL